MKGAQRLWKRLLIGVLTLAFSGSLCKKPTEEEEIITELPGVYQLQEVCGKVDSLLPPNFPRHPRTQGSCVGSVWRPPHLYTLLNFYADFPEAGYAYAVYRYTLMGDTLVDEKRVYPVGDSDTAYINLFDVSPDERWLAVTHGALNMFGGYWQPLHVVLVDLLRGTEDTLPSPCPFMLDPQFSEDGKRLFVFGTVGDVLGWCEDGSMEGVWVWDLSGGGWMGKLPMVKGDLSGRPYGSYMVEHDTAWFSWGCVEGYEFPSLNPWNRNQVTVVGGGKVLVWERAERKVYEVAIPKSVFFPYNLDKWNSVFFFPAWLDETTLVVSHMIGGGAEAGTVPSGIWVIERPERFYREVRSCSSK